MGVKVNNREFQVILIISLSYLSLRHGSIMWIQYIVVRAYSVPKATLSGNCWHASLGWVCVEYSGWISSEEDSKKRKKPMPDCGGTSHQALHFQQKETEGIFAKNGNIDFKQHSSGHDFLLVVVVVVQVPSHVGL